MKAWARILIGLMAVALLAFVGIKLLQGLTVALGALAGGGNQEIVYDDDAYATQEPREEISLPPEFYDGNTYDGPTHVSKGDGISGEEQYPVNQTIEDLIEEARKQTDQP